MGMIESMRGLPNVRTKTLAGTTAGTQGTVVDIAHGLTASKIVSLEALVESTTGVWIRQAHSAGNGVAGFDFSASFSGVNVSVETHASNSASILTKPIKIFIIYEP